MSCRLKDRGGGGGKITAPKPHKTLSDGHASRDTSAPRLRSTPVSSKSGKENYLNCQKQHQRSVSRGKSSVPRQRPTFSTTTTTAVVDPLPVVKKHVLVPASGVRWSTSTLPNGKIQSSLRRTDPVEERRSSIAGGGGAARVSKGAPVSACNGKSGSKGNGGSRKNGEVVPLSSSKFSSAVRKEKNVKGRVSSVARMSLDENASAPSGMTSSNSIPKWNYVDRRLAGLDLEPKESATAGKVCSVALDEGACLLADSKPTVDNGFNGLAGSTDLCSSSRNTKGVFKNHKEKDCALLALDDAGSVVARPNETVLADANSKETCAERNATDRINVFENVVEKKPEQGGLKAANGYSSKLHEKLALLEGKVQRIAIDIKKTKEVLDSNNPDSSKLMLSDIQNKILGIEKAVCHVIDGSDHDFGWAEHHKQDNAQMKEFGGNCTGNDPLIEVSDSKNSLRPLNNEELEARFFPHQRLLKNRMANAMGGHEKSHEPIIAKNGCDTIAGDGHGSPREEDAVALEFLASLNADDSTINMRDRTGGSVIQKIGSENTSSAEICSTKCMASGSCSNDVNLTTNEKLSEFDEQENKKAAMPKYESDDSLTEKLFDIGRKAATGGWFVSEGEAVLLAHGDGSCSFYDIANTEMKSQYMLPPSVPSNIWGDCWLIRAPGVDGCAGRYVVAASAGNALVSGFCSWDFYKRDVQAVRIEGMPSFSASSRTVLAPLPSVGVERGSLSTISSPENRQWWYRPCGYLIASAASRRNIVTAYDVRDGDLIMSWGVQNPIVAMENSSPLQWRNRSKIIVAETEAISLWDVNSLNPQSLLSVSCGGKRILAIHVNNTDAEPGGGVRQRVSSSEIEGNDGVFCTQDSINVLDFRLQSGVGLKISKDVSSTVHSVYSRGDSILLGSSKARSMGNIGTTSGIQQFSLRKGKVISTYLLPDAKTHAHQSSLTQVWGNSNLVMGICGMGLFVFDTHKGRVACERESEVDVRETIGSNDLYDPSFDYLGERVLLISRDRPAMWKYLS